MLQAKINNETFDVELKDGEPLINGSPLSWDFVRISESKFHIIYQNKSYSAELIQLDKINKQVSLKMNGNVYKVDVKDRYDILLEKMGIKATAAAKPNSVKAPMPGLIVQVKVSVGNTVKPGDALLILEAMKMENTLKASAEATVKSIKIKKGDSVEKGQVLIEF